MSVVNLLDTGGAYTLASIDGLDTLTAGDRKVVITQQVLDEIRNSIQYAQKFDQWLAQNGSNVSIISKNITSADIERYNPTGKSN
jgi:hypothetical protein